ncbi:D-2-hydroxyacid dehydrogenase [Frigidibacter sp. MR17.24]|uniref:D-2-hydroxyacid dehydrogenase n=1 Tax=Frigidibacter sp. MR17.24 TaxID=3127345 RepID=UPI003012E3B8
MPLTPPLPGKDRLHILFAHAAYDMKPRFDAAHGDIATTQVRTYDDLAAALPGADVLVTSMMWRNELLPRAGRLRFLQSVSAGTNQYDVAAFRAAGILLVSGQGVNTNAVSEQAIGLMLSLTRRLAEARDNQSRRFWRPNQSDPARREDEVAGKTMLVVGLGGIGARIARLAQAFGMRVIGIRRDPGRGAAGADAVHGFDDLPAVLPAADVVVLACPLTETTADLMDAAAFARMQPGAILVNVARGGCVDEEALAAALIEGRIAGAALDVTRTEPLPAESPLWDLPNLLITPHAAGETRAYEGNVLALLDTNLARLAAGRDDLVNRIA